MERHLYQIALVMGLVSAVYGLLLSPRRRGVSSVPRGNWILAIALPVLVFLFTLPAKPPFADGQGFGRGFLLGGLGALLAGWLTFCALRKEAMTARISSFAIAVTSPQAIAVVVSVVPMLWMRSNLYDTLLGVTIGWFCGMVVLLFGLKKEDNEAVAPLTATLGFIVTLCGLFVLGEARSRLILHGSVQIISWSAVGALLAASIPFFTLLCSLPNALFAQIALRLPLANLFAGASGKLFNAQEARDNVARGVRLLLGLALYLLLAWWVGKRMMDEINIFRLTGVGLLTATLAWWVTAERARLREANPAHDAQNSALALLIVVAGSMLAYQWLQGFGIGLLLIAAWLPITLAIAAAPEAPESEQATFAASELLRLLLFGAVLMLYRVMTTRFHEDLSGVSITDQYALIALLVGAIAPTLLSGYVLRAENRLFRLVVAGGIALFIPGVTLLLYGAKFALALLMGTALSFAFPREPQRDSTLAPGLVSQTSASFAIAIGLALAQWTHRALSYSLLSRPQRMHLLEAVIGAMIVALLAADYGQKFRQRKGAAK